MIKQIYEGLALPQKCGDKSWTSPSFGEFMRESGTDIVDAPENNLMRSCESKY